jgi:hypothetical protein
MVELFGGYQYFGSGPGFKWDSIGSVDPDHATKAKVTHKKEEEKIFHVVKC